MILLILFSCSKPALLDPGNYYLEGYEVSGKLVAGKNPTIELIGPTFGTLGPTPYTVTDKDNLGSWIRFSMETSAGTARATICIESSDRAFIPLGSRPGELEIVLNISQEEKLIEGRAEFLEKITLLQEAWKTGSYRLEDPFRNTLTGSIQLAPKQAFVELFDITMLTDSQVPGFREDRGPDIKINFPIEPSLNNELGEIIFNIPSLKVIFPSGPIPALTDRQLNATPGIVSQEERIKSTFEAKKGAVLRERSMLSQIVPELYEELKSGCQPGSILNDQWTDFLEQYDITNQPFEKDCKLTVTPRYLQHTRNTTAVMIGDKLDLESENYE